jgi:hypothetical protein
MESINWYNAAYVYIDDADARWAMRMKPAFAISRRGGSDAPENHTKDDRAAGMLGSARRRGIHGTHRERRILPAATQRAQGAFLLGLSEQTITTAQNADGPS